jgi:RNA polymerase sigma-70 factor (ECF subfamily)
VAAVEALSGTGDDDAEFPRTLKAAQAGRKFALTALYQACNPLLLSYFRAQVSDVSEDLCQETWLVLGNRLRQFRGDERAFRVWLLVLAREQLVSYRQNTRRLQTVSMAPAALTRAVGAGRNRDPRIADVAIAELLAGLPEAHQEVLLLRVVAGLNAEETGAVIGKSPGAVRVIQHRALRHLAGRLSDDRARQ